MSVPAPRLRARYGDRRALRSLRAHHLDRLARLGAALGNSPEESAALATTALQTAARSTGSFDDALVRAFGALAAQRADPAAALGGLLVVLVDLSYVPVERAAALLDLPASAARALLAGARTGSRPFTVVCRGWGLASGHPGLTSAEREAGAGHLLLCRHCRDRRAAAEAARRQLAVRATGTAGLLAAGQLATSFSTGLAGLATGKAVIGAVAGLGAAVLATGTAVAVVPPSGFTPTGRPPAVAPAEIAPSVLPATEAGTDPSGVASPAPLATPSSCLTPSVGQLAPTAVPTLPALPVVEPTLLPELPLPTSVPLPLPTLPTSLPSPLPTLPRLW